MCDGGEIILRPNGLCNLSEVIIREGDSAEDLARKVRVATIIGTFQSTLTDFRYIRKIWERNAKEERLLGVSLTGIMDSPLTNSNAKDLGVLLGSLREVSVLTNKEWADKLGIPQSAAITTVNS